MRRSVRDKLVEALASGEFPKTKQKLRRALPYTNELGDITHPAGFCCLGVACELYRREVGGEWVEGANGSMEFKAKPLSRASNYLPTEVAAWMGLSVDEGGVPENDIPLARVHIGNSITNYASQVNDSSDTWKPVIEALKTRVTVTED